MIRFLQRLWRRATLPPLPAQHAEIVYAKDGKMRAWLNGRRVRDGKLRVGFDILSAPGWSFSNAKEISLEVPPDKDPSE